MVPVTSSTVPRPRTPHRSSSRDPAGAGATGRWTRMDGCDSPRSVPTSCACRSPRARTGWRCGPASRSRSRCCCSGRSVAWSGRSMPRSARSPRSTDATTSTCPACRCRWRRGCCCARRPRWASSSARRRTGSGWPCRPPRWCAGLGSLCSDALGWHPPGPLFLVFAFAACASIPSTPADVAVAVLVASATAAFAVLVGYAGSAWRSWRLPDAAADALAAYDVRGRRAAAPGPQRRRRAGGGDGLDRGRDRPPLLGDGLRGRAARGHRTPGAAGARAAPDRRAPWSGWGWRRCSSPSTPAGWC